MLDNPDIAVALRYQLGNGVPMVVAKGSGYIASRIVEAARNAGVAVETDAELARALATVELNQEIPPALYKAVAQIMAYLIRKSHTSAKSAAMGASSLSFQAPT